MQPSEPTSIEDRIRHNAERFLPLAKHRKPGPALMTPDYRTPTHRRDTARDTAPVGWCARCGHPYERTAAGVLNPTCECAGDPPAVWSPAWLEYRTRVNALRYVPGRSL